MTIVIHDVSACRRAEQEARQRERETAALAAASWAVALQVNRDQALHEVLRQDFCTPLASIKAGVTALLEEGIAWDAASQRELLREINQAVDRLSRMVDNISLEELLARMRTVLRRTDSGEGPAMPSLSLGSLHVDFVRRRVTLAGRGVHLTPTEFDLLRCLMANADRVLTHRQLLTRVWGPAYAEDIHTLQVHVANLRRKIEPDASRIRYIHTEPRIGYRFRATREPVSSQS